MKLPIDVRISFVREGETMVTAAHVAVYPVREFSDIPRALRFFAKVIIRWLSE